MPLWTRFPGRLHTGLKILPNEIHSASRARRVLLVDDDPIVLELISLLLAGSGVDVVHAVGGQEGLEALETPSELPDFILVDQQMPQISGTDIARYIRSLPQPRPRVIAMSASPLPEDELALFDDYLAKPIDQDLLRAAISGAPARSASASSRPPVSGLPPSLDSSTVTKLQAIMPPSAIRELYTIYVADTRQRIREMEQYSAEGDDAGVRRCAHALKGSAAMAGVPGIATIAAGLEAGQLPRHDHENLFHQMRSACDDVEQSMINSAAHTSAASGEAR
jgi:CheY-like chemotaxis protein/HPt (histidine-containing phosphotransfer) domain-containing protein